MSKEEFVRNFPHDEYMDENAKNKWKQVKTVYTGSGMLASGKKFALGKLTIEPGWYLIEVAAKDKYGRRSKRQKLYTGVGRQNIIAYST
jgi:hypothetical protein